MDIGSRPIMAYGEPAITGGSHPPKQFRVLCQWARGPQRPRPLGASERSDPGEPAQTGSLSAVYA